MTDALALTLAASLAAALQTSPSGAPQQQDDVFIVSVATRPDKCNLSLATKADLFTLTSKPEEWIGKCVAVDGYW